MISFCCLFKVKNEEPVDIGSSLKKLSDGSFELVKDNKVLAKIDANGEIINYLYYGLRNW